MTAIDSPKSDLKLLMQEVAELYTEKGILVNWFPFKIKDDVCYRIYWTDVRVWKIYNPLVNGSYEHFASIEEAIEWVIKQVKDELPTVPI